MQIVRINCHQSMSPFHFFFFTFSRVLIILKVLSKALLLHKKTADVFVFLTFQKKSQCTVVRFSPKHWRAS